MGIIDDIVLAEARKVGRTATKASVDQAIDDAAPGLKAVAARVAGAEEKFVKWAMNSAKLTKPQAEKALATMRKLKVVKIDANVGQFTFKHGAFAEPEVVRRAAGLEEESMRNLIDDIVLEDIMGKTMGFAPPPKVKNKPKAKVGGTVSFVNPDTGKTQKLTVTKIDGTTIWAKGKGGSEYSIVMSPGGGDPENLIRWPARRGSFPANPRYKKGSFKFEGVELSEGGIDPQGKGENKDGDTDVMPAKGGKFNVFLRKGGKWNKVAGPFDSKGEAVKAAEKIEKGKSEAVEESKFEKLKNKLASKGDVEDPAAVAASIGRKKYGKEKFKRMASDGKKNESLDEAKVGGMGKWGKSRKDIVKILDKGPAPDMSGAKALASKLGDGITVEKKGKMLFLMNASGTPVYGVGPNDVVWYYYQGLREQPVGFVADAKKASVSHDEPKYPEFKGLPKEDPWLMAAKIDPKNPALPAHLREADELPPLDDKFDDWFNELMQAAASGKKTKTRMPRRNLMKGQKYVLKSKGHVSMDMMGMKYGDWFAGTPVDDGHEDYWVVIHIPSMKITKSYTMSGPAKGMAAALGTTKASFQVGKRWSNMIHSKLGNKPFFSYEEIYDMCTDDQSELTMESLAEFARGTARARLVEEDLGRIADASRGVSLESMPRAFERKHAFGAPNLEYGIINEEDEYLSEALPSGTVEMFLLVMQNQLIAQDKTEMKRALKARRPDNPYRLGLFMKALNSVREDVKDIIHSDDKKDLERLKKSLGEHFNNFPPLNRTLKAIDKFIATGKNPTLTKLKEHSSAINPRPAGGPLQESNERELFEMIEKCTPGGVPDSIMESLEAGVAEVINDLHGSIMESSVDPLSWIMGRDLKDDIARNKQHGYVPAAQVLGNREEGRQRDQINALGKKMFGKNWASEIDTKTRMWVTYRDNRDRSVSSQNLRSFAKEVGKLGYKVKTEGHNGNDALIGTMYVLYDMKRIKQAVAGHKRYLDAMVAGGANRMDESAAVLDERKSKGDYGRGAGGRASELSWKSGSKPDKDVKKAANKGERRGKKAHIDAQMRGEDIEELALSALLGE